MLRLCIVSRGGGLEAPLSFKMTQWSSYWIGESVCYWLEKGNAMDTWRRRTRNTWRWRITLIKSERCYWMTASLYRKYNTFSDRESEQQHRTMTIAELPNHPLLLTMACVHASSALPFKALFSLVSIAVWIYFNRLQNTRALELNYFVFETFYLLPFLASVHELPSRALWFELCI